MKRCRIPAGTSYLSSLMYLRGSQEVVDINECFGVYAHFLFSSLHYSPTDLFPLQTFLAFVVDKTIFSFQPSKV